MAKNSRIIAALLALTMLFVVLSSASFLIAQAEHDCPGEECPICCLLSACGSALRLAFCAVLSAAVLVQGLRGASGSFSVISRETLRHPSLVSLRVKLSD